MSSTEPPVDGGISRGGLIVSLVVAIALFLGGGALVLAPTLFPRSEAAAPPPRITQRPSPTPTPTPSTTPTPRRASVAPLAPLDAQLNARVLFAHQSTGAEISKGVPAAFKAKKLKAPTVAKWTKVMRTSGPVFATATIGTNGDPTSKLRAFAALVNDAPRDSIDVALMAFNYQDITAETDIDALFGIYAATMQSLEDANPSVRFLYTTVPVTESNNWSKVDADAVDGLSDVSQPVWQNNIARERYNTLVRQEYGDTGRLFDIAAQQANLGKGKVAAKQHESHWYHVMNPALTSDGRKLNSKGSTRLATQLMMLVASVHSD